VTEVRSVARRPLVAGAGWAGSPARLAHVTADVASPEAREALHGCDIVYHLAAQVWAGRGPRAMDDMHRANVVGTANVLAASVGAVVVASSVAVYGAWPDNPLPMDEGRVPRPNVECPYAQHKLVAELGCRRSRVPSAVARLSAVLGPHADARVAKAVGGYRLAVPAVRGTAQAVQWLDEEDAVGGVLAVGAALLSGAVTDPGEVFNLAPGDWLGAPDVARLAGGRVVEMGLARLLALSELARRAGVAPFGADRAVLVNGPLALSAAKAARDLGWRARSSSAQVLSAALERSWRASPLNRRA
jgi:UDP-glucose 4-epimerase